MSPEFLVPAADGGDNIRHIRGLWNLETESAWGQFTEDPLRKVCFRDIAKISLALSPCKHHFFWLDVLTCYLCHQCISANMSTQRHVLCFSLWIAKLACLNDLQQQRSGDRQVLCPVVAVEPEVGIIIISSKVILSKLDTIPASRHCWTQNTRPKQWLIEP